MGKVFTWKEVRSGAIPSLEQFDTVKAIVREEIVRCDVIEAASFIGSAATGSHTLRSDVDVLVCRREKRSGEVDSVFERLRRLAVPFHIDIDDCSVDHVSSHFPRAKTIGAMMAAHVYRLGSDAAIKGEPMSLIQPSEMPGEAQIFDYIQCQMPLVEKFAHECWLFPPSLRFRCIGVAVNAVQHLARMVLWHKRHDVVSLPKPAVVDYYERMACPGSAHLRRIVSADAVYTAALRKQVARPCWFTHWRSRFLLQRSVFEIAKFVCAVRKEVELPGTIAFALLC